MRARIVCLPGDGTGPEVIKEAIRVLTSVACAFDHSFTFIDEKFGESAFQTYGKSVPEKTLEACKAADAILLGSFSKTSISTQNITLNSMSLLQSGLNMHTGLQLCQNVHAAESVPSFGGGVDNNTEIALVWPLPDTAEPPATLENDTVHDTISLSPTQAELVLRAAFRLARERRRSLCGTFSSTLPAAKQLWHTTALRVATDFPDVSARWLEAEQCAAELVTRSSYFDVLLVDSMQKPVFAGIAAGLSGSFNLSPCVMLGDTSPMIYLPANEPDASLAGRDMASPIAMILSAALMLRKSLQLNKEADCVEMAVRNVLNAGWRTADLARSGEPRVGTEAIGKLIAEQVDTAGAVMASFRR